MSHPSGRLDDVVHQRVRLGILAVLDATGQADFSYLQDQLEVTAGNLSTHLSVLADAGYIDINKTFEGNRPRTWARITQEGKIALFEEVQALGELLNLQGHPDEHPTR